MSSKLAIRATALTLAVVAPLTYVPAANAATEPSVDEKQIHSLVSSVSADPESGSIAFDGENALAAGVKPELVALTENNITQYAEDGKTENAEVAWVPVAMVAARAIVAAARAVPGAYRALSSAVRAGYGTFNSWCINNPAICAIPGGLGTAALYDALTSLV